MVPMAVQLLLLLLLQQRFNKSNNDRINIYMIVIRIKQ